MTRLAELLRQRSTAVSVAVLACLAYVPALTAAPGRMPADSKLYVYLNPGRFLVDTTTSFDPRQFAGWVPHQHIAYLWPTAPWFWMFEQLGAPDWIAHRLWIGTLLLVAGLGVRWVSRVLGLAPLAALVAALVYQLSPYVLPYVSRTSVLLLPWAGLGWIVGLTVLAAQRGRWRFPAAIAVVVLTVGAVNATALAMIIPAPTLWLAHAVWNRSITWRRALATAAKVAVLSTAVSLWWMAMLIIQGRRGGDVLAYSESLESVSFTSTSTEVLRGLGYWLFYLRDSFAAATTSSLAHLISIPVVIAGFGLVLLCLLGIVISEWEHRRFAALLVGAGLVLAVGVHPIDDTSPLMSALLGDRESGLALALRSSTRAVPVLMLGMALGAASLVSTARTMQFRRGPIWFGGVRASVAIASVIGLLAVVNLPALRNGGFVDPTLERDEQPPAAWLDASAALDALPNGYRVLQIPGTEFGAYQWGYTVDQPLPALTERPLLTRDLLPLGSPAAMDLVFALDDRVQDGTLDPAAVAPIARLLGVDTIWLTNDVQFDRFRLARPELVADLLAHGGVEGLGEPTSFGEPTAMLPQVPYIDEQSIGNALVGTAIAPVQLLPVSRPVPTVRVKDEIVVVSGSGDGLVDAAGAGLIDGTELIRYSASLDSAEVANALDAGVLLIVTDSNRDRAHHWRSSQDVHGATEFGGPGVDVLRFEPADQRLPVFATAEAATQTVVIQDGPVRATASAYGEPFAYLPEHRPAMAIDGDLTTSWVVADRSPAIGEFIRLDVSFDFDHITLRQPDSAPGTRVITDIRIDGLGDPISVALDERSLTGTGQRIEIGGAAGSTVDIVMTGTSAPQPPIAGAIGAVGFAEIELGLAPTVEVIRVPTDATDAGSDNPTSYVFSRLRADAQDRFRSDPEPTLNRQFDVAADMTSNISVTLRVMPNASGNLLSQLFDERGQASDHLAGTLTARGHAAVDGDPATAWITPFDDVVGQSLTDLGSGSSSTIRLTQLVGDFSPVTTLRITDGEGNFDVGIAGPDVTIELPRPVDVTQASVTLLEIDARRTIDRRFGEPVTLPAAISSIDFVGSTIDRSSTFVANDECRDDLLELDGKALGVSVSLDVDAALSGDYITVDVCDGPLDLVPGTHRLSTAAGHTTGIDIDRVVLQPGERAASTTSAIDPTQTVLVEGGRHARTVAVPPCPTGCWVVLGEGFNDGWTARTSSGMLPGPELVDGNANGWWITPTDAATTVEIQWTPQRTLSIALFASLFSALAALAIVVLDRRRSSDVALTAIAPELATWNPDARRSIVLIGAIAAAAAALVAGWMWAVPAVAVAIVAVVARRVRVLAIAGWLIVAGVSSTVIFVVGVERPFPNAGWPIRFEWLHGWTLLGIMLLMCSALTNRRQPVPEASCEATSGDE
ncbi:MAG: arabinofuranan 3-O-arabinosyltransferase [Candidatus Azotimanducaceae bacterium]|jgi:arabinofuranan 3-O-arabinosyltransferase